MDAESLSSSEGLKPAATVEFGASTTDDLEFQAYGMSGLLCSPPRNSFPQWNDDLFEDGYDSDGEILLPKDDEDEEGDDEQELPSSGQNPAASEGVEGHSTHTVTSSQPSATEEAVGGSVHANMSLQPSATVSTNSTQQEDILTDAAIDEMFVPELKKQLNKRGQSSFMHTKQEKGFAARIYYTVKIVM